MDKSKTNGLVLTLALLSSSAASDGRGEMVPCQSSGCVLMILDLGSAPKDHTVVDRKRRDDGFTDFTLHVRGRLDSGDIQSFTLLFRGYTDGIHCSDFGQGNVWVSGFSSALNPILSTSLGMLEVTDNSLRVGCSDCLTVEVDGASRRFTSPSWDLTLTGHGPGDFFSDDAGNAYVRQGAACVQLFSDSEFRVVSNDHCSSTAMSRTNVAIRHGACT